jgi:hypothetical protein
MPRYVILNHDHPVPHFDLMLESGGRLRTWRLLGNPFSSSPVKAEPLGDHRIDYLEYEGPVSGDRGRVARWDSGSYEILGETPAQLMLRLDGTRCRGRAALESTNGKWEWRYSGE